MKKFIFRLLITLSFISSFILFPSSILASNGWSLLANDSNLISLSNPKTLTYTSSNGNIYIYVLSGEYNGITNGSIYYGKLNKEGLINGQWLATGSKSRLEDNNGPFISTSSQTYSFTYKDYIYVVTIDPATLNTINIYYNQFNVGGNDVKSAWKKSTQSINDIKNFPGNLQGTVMGDHLLIAFQANDKTNLYSIKLNEKGGDFNGTWKQSKTNLPIIDNLKVGKFNLFSFNNYIYYIVGDDKNNTLTNMYYAKVKEGEVDDNWALSNKSSSLTDAKIIYSSPVIFNNYIYTVGRANENTDDKTNIGNLQLYYAKLNSEGGDVSSDWTGALNTILPFTPSTNALSKITIEKNSYLYLIGNASPKDSKTVSKITNDVYKINFNDIIKSTDKSQSSSSSSISLPMIIVAVVVASLLLTAICIFFLMRKHK